MCVCLCFSSIRELVLLVLCPAAKSLLHPSYGRLPIGTRAKIEVIDLLINVLSDTVSELTTVRHPTQSIIHSYYDYIVLTLHSTYSFQFTLLIVLLPLEYFLLIILYDSLIILTIL